MLKRFVALLLGLAIAAPAAPQGIPNFLPANTVVGRLASNPGPTSAIPFATLAAQLGVGSTYLVGANISGTNAITATTTAAPALATNQTVIFVPANTNTAATTFNRDSTGAVNVFYNGVATVGGEIVAGVPTLLFYDGTQYNVLANGVAAGNAQVRGTVSSATTTNLDTSTSTYQQISGTTTITGITLASGHVRVVEFSGILTLTNGASLVLPGAANIVTAAGDTAIFAGDASGVVRCVVYTRAAASSGLPVGFSMSPITNSLSGDVSLSNTANYFDGPSVAQGTSGTWFASGTVTLTITGAVTDFFDCKLWDGTTVISSGRAFLDVNGENRTLSLSGYIASPAANIRISCKDETSTSAKILFNGSGNSKDSTITAIRIG